MVVDVPVRGATEGGDAGGITLTVAPLARTQYTVEHSSEQIASMGGPNTSGDFEARTPRGSLACSRPRGGIDQGYPPSSRIMFRRRKGRGRPSGHTTTQLLGHLKQALILHKGEGSRLHLVSVFPLLRFRVYHRRLIVCILCVPKNPPSRPTCWPTSSLGLVNLRGSEIGKPSCWSRRLKTACEGRS